MWRAAPNTSSRGLHFIKKVVFELCPEKANPIVRFRFSPSWDCAYNMLYLWSLGTFCLLLSVLKWSALLSPLPSTFSPLHPFPFTFSSSLFTLFPPLFLLAWDRGRAMTEVSAQVTVIRSCCSFPTGPGVNTFLPVLGPHQSAPCVLRIYIPAHQELPPFSLPGVWLHWTIVGEKPVWTFLFLIFHLFFQSPRLVIVHVPVSFSHLTACLLSISDHCARLTVSVSCTFP